MFFEEKELFDALPFAIIAHDTQRKIFLFNKTAEKLTGYKREEVIGRDCHEVFKGGFCGQKCSFREGIITPEFEKLHYPLEFINKKGEKLYLDMQVLPIYSSKELKGVLAVFEDLKGEIEFIKSSGEITNFYGIIGKNEKMLRLYQQIKNVSKVSVPVLILGESGTGKELVAETIHKLSPRKNYPFVVVNCGAIPDTLIESELFGYEKGAFTGAIKGRKGRFELANRGTIFLDEIGDITPAMQVKLLRVIQTCTIEKLGGEGRPIRLDIRIISATNKDLKEEIKKGNFREDLFYRLSVIPLEIPPLRERKDDIPLLVEHYIKEFASAFSLNTTEISKRALEILINYHWPGNVRELQNVIQFSLIEAQNYQSKIIKPKHLPKYILQSLNKSSQNKKEIPLLKRTSLTLDMVKQALEEAKGNKVKAAKLLNISRATLYRFLEKHKIS